MTDPVAVDRRPARLDGTVAVVAAAAGAGLASTASDAGLVVGVAGTVLVAAGVGAGSARAVGYGAVGAFGAALLAGLAGGSVAAVVGATLAAVLAWDLGERAVVLGEQVGREAAARRGELVHVAATLGVGGAAAFGAVAVYRLGVAGLSTTALVALAAAGLLLTMALRH